MRELFVLFILLCMAAAGIGMLRILYIVFKKNATEIEENDHLTLSDKEEKIYRDNSNMLN